METITLNDGTILNGHILEDGFGQRIFVYIDGMSLMQGFMLMSNASKTSVMVANNRGTEHTYTGFTDFVLIQKSEFTIDVELVGNNIDIKQERILVGGGE